MEEIEFSNEDEKIINNINGWFIVNKKTIQQSSYIEDGPYIKKYEDGTYCLYEIPKYGGNELYIGEFKTIIEAIEYSEKLT